MIFALGFKLNEFKEEGEALDAGWSAIGLRAEEAHLGAEAVDFVLQAVDGLPRVVVEDHVAGHEALEAIGCLRVKVHAEHSDQSTSRSIMQSISEKVKQSVSQ